MNKIKPQLLIIALLFFACAGIISAQTTTFTYQGKLNDSSMLANGSYDLGFALYDQPTGGNQIGVGLTRANVIRRQRHFYRPTRLRREPFSRRGQIFTNCRQASVRY